MGRNAKAAQRVTEDTPRKGPLAGVLALLGVGVAVSVVLIGMKMDIELGTGTPGDWGCEKGSGCHAVQMSDQSKDPVLGLPIALYAIPTYLAMAFLALFGLLSRPTQTRPDAVRHARAAVYALGGLGALTVLYSLYLFSVAVFAIGDTCKYCMMLYAVNIGATLLAVLAVPGGLGGFVRGLKQSLDGSPKMAVQAVALLGVATIAAVAVYNGLHERTARERTGMQLAQAEKAFEDEEYEEVVEQAPVAMAANAPAPGTAAAQPTAAPTPAAPAAAQQVVKRKPKAKMTENGLSFYEAPVADNDFPKGAADAQVTVVKFADFECGYCRILDLNMRPLVDKYKGQVRWVMKHYPMNADCNPRMGGERMHPKACDASFASHCAGEQGKFWEMHDKLYDNQQNLDMESIKGHVQALGLDMGRWETCMKAPTTAGKIKEDIAQAAKAGIYGTPRAYVNGRLVSGSAGTQVLDYYIQKSLEEVERGGALEQAAGEVSAESAEDQAKARSAKGEFWIDSFEASIDKDGRAVSVPKVDPAQASWFDAKQACEKAGKRLCTEEEWVSACTGAPAVDNNGNQFFADDDVEGRMYPYGLFYEAGTCRDAEDEYKGQPTQTGAMGGCRTPEGIFDLAGNLMEWVGPEQNTAALVGGDWRGGERSSCNRRTTTFGPGQRNNTTGFRCCSDQRVTQAQVAAADLRQAVGDVLGQPLPKFEVTLPDGSKFTQAQAKGKVTYLTFFAAWCGSCKRELPELNNWHEELAGKGLQVVAVGVDKVQKQSEDFAGQFSPKYTVGYDPDAVVMGLFDINAMPTSFLIDRNGVVRHREVGFKQDEVPQMKQRVVELLGQK